MTKLTDGTVIRETPVLYRGRPIIIELHPTHVVYRVKGLRDRIVLDHEVGMAAAQKVAARESGIKI